ncbi:SAM-dependent MidA family methyltransferase [Thermocatellispora tengchongensis]|uniref:SAM-dependent MidA family methyltransferase n=1 Tax=Thermocatellispora tengchongensis TaxID=1073253 RepID=A0A840PMN7_9ACTN|nr:SAM-dependent methyltransferase [Thermocatellispora tengchongensis]MBB5140322.1 SAM-dependent MidA family methyltransferase [Thermocatellispora tengchongensis]
MWPTWRAAMERALYGEGGFYLRERPSRHFRTSVSASPIFAEAVLTILADVDARLGRPSRIDLVDVGAGEGTLVRHVLDLAPPSLAARLAITAVDLADRPPGLPEAITWAAAPPGSITGLVIANEWLDNVPLDFAEQTADGPRLVLVDPATGEERLGPPPEPADAEWLERWWPLPAVGLRAEIGRSRDEAWAGVVTRIVRGRAIAIDYAHPVDNRPLCGTLTGYRDGSVVPPIPDGTCDITAHVALDACAAAAERARGFSTASTTLTTQREALRALGMTGARPLLALAHTDPRTYLRALARSSQEAELIDPGGLGSFGWLSQDIEL